MALLLTLHLMLAVRSLVRENPTVDEVAHLPAGVSYWQTGSFRLYHHNPPLVKLVAALPVVLSNPETRPLYEMPSWTDPAPSQATFSQNFAYINASRYFELFTRARLLMPLFSIVGGLVVFAWSCRLYGAGAGLLSLALWSFCPNVLAHGRLVTTDLGAAAVGAGATFLFWRYLQSPRWPWVLAAGVGLGLAQLTKFSLILLYGIWPFLWLVRLALTSKRDELPGKVLRGTGYGAVVVALSVLTIDAGYLFEGVGIPLGRFAFASGALTKPVQPGDLRPSSKNPLLDMAWRHRINRFRSSALGAIPCPLPEHYVLGFDEQKLEAEGLPSEWFPAAPGQAAKGGKKSQGYSVYLDGVLRQSGWWYYYLLALVYKVPEGTWCLVVLSICVLLATGRSREAWADEVAVGTFPLTILFTMSFLTDINLGIRYVLPIAPYVFVGAGRLVPWASSLRPTIRAVVRTALGASVGLAIVSTLAIHPHYLAYFNTVSGGPDRQPPHLIDSNLDWGQDLVNLKDWVRKNAPGERIGLAYFGQINPTIFRLRNEGFDWFLPPALPGTVVPMEGAPLGKLIGPARRLTPGWYAVSATLVYGLPWRLYDPLPDASAWPPTWNAWKPHAFGYFRSLTPRVRIGHSIYVYRVTEEDAVRLAPLWDAGKQRAD